ncbi:MAG: hypothetical protein IJS65_05890 [Clostridia bacterium]|nr:hypothetical protein [Clostridia bacterium]
MRTGFKAAAFILAVFAAACFSGCSSLKPPAEDAGKYVLTALDIICKGEYDRSKSIDGANDLLKSRETLINNAVSAFTGDSADVSAGQVAKIHDMWATAFSKCRYSLGEITETEEGYEIEVVIEPLKLLKKSADEVVGELKAEVLKDKEFLKNASEDDIAARGVDMLIERIDRDVEDPAYADPVRITVFYCELSPATYGISNGDGTKLCDALFDMSAFKEYYAK